MILDDIDISREEETPLVHSILIKIKCNAVLQCIVGILFISILYAFISNFDYKNPMALFFIFINGLWFIFYFKIAYDLFYGATIFFTNPEKLKKAFLDKNTLFVTIIVLIILNSSILFFVYF